MKLKKMSNLSKNEIEQIYWLDFIEEVEDSFVPKSKNGYASSDTWGIKPTINDFWEWFVKSGKRAEISNINLVSEDNLIENEESQADVKSSTE